MSDMSDPRLKNLQTAEHYTWGDVCDGWRLLAGSDLAVTQERIPPGRGEVRHYHERARQLFFVLSGQLSIELDSSVFRLGPADSLEVPPVSQHRVWNEAPEDVWFLVISAPTTRTDRIDVDPT
jgi:mannose-6-phosphate isomerase-like protein (cupin superfamily)